MRNVPDRYQVNTSDGLKVSAWPVKSNALAAVRELARRNKSIGYYAFDSRNGEIFIQRNMPVTK